MPSHPEMSSQVSVALLGSRTHAKYTVHAGGAASQEPAQVPHMVDVRTSQAFWHIDGSALVTSSGTTGSVETPLLSSQAPRNIDIASAKNVVAIRFM